MYSIRDAEATGTEAAGMAIGEALRHFQGQDKHCALLIVDHSAALAPHFDTIPVMTMTPDGLTTRAVQSATRCDSMVVVREQGQDDDGDEWLDRLPWIRRPLFITSSPYLLSHAGHPILGRLEPIFFAWEPRSNGSTAGPGKFSVHEKPFHSHLKKAGIFDGSGYHLGGGGGGGGPRRLGDLPAFPAFRTDFGGLEVPGVAFSYRPYSMPDFSGRGDHGGVEYDIAAAVTRAIGLRLTVHPPSTGRLWGRPDKHGNFSG